MQMLVALHNYWAQIVIKTLQLSGINPVNFIHLSDEQQSNVRTMYEDSRVWGQRVHPETTNDINLKDKILVQNHFEPLYKEVKEYIQDVATNLLYRY